jgi:myo-inositol-1(or 4)-monophosphatase
LDGTTNYAHRYPCYAVSVAVACEGEIVAGVVLDPERDECFQAAAGDGATLNGEKIAVSDVQEIGQAVLAVSLPPRLHDGSPDLKSFLRTAPRCQAVRRTGSAALNLAYVACGRMDGHWAHEIHVWDGAAGILLVREAGGVATACDGQPYNLANADYLASGTPELHRTLLEAIQPQEAP